MGGQKILVISADPYQSRIVNDCLENAGYQVKIDGRGKGALDAIRQAKPDLVLLDWKLPDISGLTIARMIRADEQISEIPLVLIGAEMSDEDRLRGYEAGADICLADPIDPKVFVARVRALFRRAVGQS